GPARGAPRAGLAPRATEPCHPPGLGGRRDRLTSSYPLPRGNSSMRQSLRSSLVALFATLPVLLAFAGCGNGDNTRVARVTGTVSYKGKPLRNMVINFMPPDGRPSWGKTDSNGKFELDYDDTRKGAKVGHHKVFMSPGVQTIDGGRSKESKKAIAQGVGISQEEMNALFAKYGSEENTKLEID